MRKLIKIFKDMWKFITQEPKERTDEEWEQFFAVAEALKRNREMRERRNRKYRAKSPYTAMYRRRTKRRY